MKTASWIITIHAETINFMDKHWGSKLFFFEKVKYFASFWKESKLFLFLIWGSHNCLSMKLGKAALQWKLTNWKFCFYRKDEAVSLWKSKKVSTRYSNHMYINGDSNKAIEFDIIGKMCKNMWIMVFRINGFF